MDNRKNLEWFSPNKYGLFGKNCSSQKTTQWLFMYWHLNILGVLTQDELNVKHTYNKFILISRFVKFNNLARIYLGSIYKSKI